MSDDTESGLREVSSPSEFFLAERSRGEAGSCVLAAIEGHVLGKAAVMGTYTLNPDL